jgi:hypothetical protein
MRRIDAISVMSKIGELTDLAFKEDQEQQTAVTYARYEALAMAEAIVIDAIRRAERRERILNIASKPTLEN